MKNIQCRKCVFLKDYWCNEKRDSPVDDIDRDCPYYREKTNGDRYRAMSNEQLAELFSEIETEGRAYGPRGKAAWLAYLEEAAE